MTVLRRFQRTNWNSTANAISKRGERGWLDAKMNSLIRVDTQYMVWHNKGPRGQEAGADVMWKNKRARTVLHSEQQREKCSKVKWPPPPHPSAESYTETEKTQFLLFLKSTTGEVCGYTFYISNLHVYCWICIWKHSGDQASLGAWETGENSATVSIVFLCNLKILCHLWYCCFKISKSLYIYI